MQILPDSREVSKAAGFIGPNNQVKIVDLKSKKTLGPNERGEIYAKSPKTMTGYYNNEEKTKEVLEEDGMVKLKAPF